MNATLEGRILEMRSETESSALVIIEGSDDHLDGILDVLTPLKDLTLKLKAVNEAFWENMNEIPRERLKSDLLPQLVDLQKVLLVYIGALVTSKYKRDINQAFSALEDQYSSFLEIISDIKIILLSDDEELGDVLHDLNNL